MKAVVYDCEIIKAIPPRDGLVIDGVKYCEGWQDHDNMGISVVGAYDYSTDRYRVFCEDGKDEWGELIESADLLVGFNNIGFDDELLVASDWPNAPTVARYDLLQEIWRAAGLASTWQGWRSHGGYGLEAVCQINFNLGKTGQGALAPVDWQQGKIGRVIDYCLDDVRLTKMLLDRACNAQAIVDPKTLDRMLLREPTLGTSVSE